MEERKNRPQRSGKEIVFYLFGLFMLVFYLGMAYMFLFSKVLAEGMSPAIRYAMGGLFLLYGLFRVYRQIKMKDQSNG